MANIDKNDDNYIYFWVGKNIKKYRKQKGWSQSKLVSECNFTDTFISNIENNSFQSFSLNTLYHISKKLEIPIKLLFEELDEDAPLNEKK